MKRSYDNIIEPRGGGGRTRGRSYGGAGGGMFLFLIFFRTFENKNFFFHCMDFNSNLF
jgi:hypothetical protein